MNQRIQPQGGDYSQTYTKLIINNQLSYSKGKNKEEVLCLLQKDGHRAHFAENIEATKRDIPQVEIKANLFSSRKLEV